MIAGLTPCSVAFGHRTLTPRFQERLREGDRFYHDPAVTAPWRRAYLDAVGARFVALPRGGGPMLGPEPPFRPILANAGLEVWERKLAAAEPAAGSDGTMRP